MTTPHANIHSPLLLSLFDLCRLPLRNHVVMAPLTRVRAGRERVPNDLMVEYAFQSCSSIASSPINSSSRCAD